MDKPKHQTNQRWWDDVTAHHVASKFYDVDGFLVGKTSLLPLELAALPEATVKGKRLLHLQCHFGLDTLSFARMGAQVVGVDFSAKAVQQATELAAKAGLAERASFTQADVLEWKDQAKPEFDVVYTSYGVMAWLSDLKPWAEGIAASLKPGGTFYMAEIHPLTECMDGEGGLKGRIEFSYFDKGRGHGAETAGVDYATGHISEHGNWQWIHPTYEVMECLRESGLDVTGFREHPYCCYSPFPGMVQRPDKYWELPAGAPKYPMIFEVWAKKPVAGPSAT